MSTKELSLAAAGAAGPLYVEDVFSTYLYTGNGGSQTITNGIDLAGKGGMVWLKDRKISGTGHDIYDTVRGVNSGYLTASATLQQVGASYGLTAFNSDGFYLGSGFDANNSGDPSVSWTFRKAPNFFDVVTWTGDGNSTKTIPHSLGSTPGFIIAKCTNYAGTQWYCYHRSLGTGQYVALNLTDAAASGTVFPSVGSSSFSVGGYYNGSGSTNVAYLFADNAGGFGADGSQSIISCGSYTTNSSGNATVNLGWEPQYVLAKVINTSGFQWGIFDTMRGMSYNNYAMLQAQSSGAEVTSPNGNIIPTATGFYDNGQSNGSNTTVIYIAIRRPMKTPTSGSQVFSPNAVSSAGYVTTGFPLDMQILAPRNADMGSSVYFQTVYDRLRGSYGSAGGFWGIGTSSTSTEAQMNQSMSWDNNTGFKAAIGGYNQVFWNFKRAPGFFDVVCYAGTGSAPTPKKNLWVLPELIIRKPRKGSGGNWSVYCKYINDGGNGLIDGLYLNTNDSDALIPSNSLYTDPTATTFTVNSVLSSSFSNYVAYLFASCPGVSKVGSYTGTGSTQTINCGFTAGARFVLIKRTDSTGSWVVHDTARGMVSGTDPFLSLDTIVAETNQNDVYTATSGFQLVSSNTNTNASGGTYIFLAIA